jgi:hypothetical protein
LWKKYLRKTLQQTYKAEKAPKDPLTLESLPNSQFTARSPTINLLEGEIPKEPIKSPFKD